MDGVEERSARFNAYYTAAQAPVIDELQRRVLGSAGGGNGHTHVGQLPVLVSALRLGPNSALLEIGAGAGWPGLALASQSGCRVVLTDPTVAGLAAAARWGTDAGISSRVVAAFGTDLPFADGTFDAVSHSDVMC